MSDREKAAIVAHVRGIEAAVYPATFQTMQDFTSWKDLVDYCENEPHVLTWPGGYALWTQSEIVDLASTTHLDLAQLRDILRAFARTCGETPVHADCRATTSYRLVRAWERAGFLEIIAESPYQWGPETFYEMCLRFTPKAQR